MSDINYLEISDSCLKDLLRLQLTEAEMLASMYPGDGEFKIDNPKVVADISDFIQDKTNVIPPRMDFTLLIEIPDKKDKLEVNASLPHDYPEAEPEVYARSAGLTRDQQHHLNIAIGKFISEQDKGELCIGSLIQWLKDFSASCFEDSKMVDTNDSTEIDSSEKDTNSFSRYWIYSHHIFNKGKRRSILELSHHLNVSGFCLPGKPGFICIEGLTHNCSEFWRRLKHMNWKKIMLKKSETLDIKDTNIDSVKRFNVFEEVCFQPRQGPGREYHMDMGEFFQYLEEHHCSYVFKEFFGIDGKSSDAPH